MASVSITCPSCRSSLTSRQPIPTGKTVRCPSCEHVFLSDENPFGLVSHPPVHVVPPLPQRSNRWLGVALVASVLLVGGGVIAAIVLTRPPSQPAPAPAPALVVEKPKDEGAEKENRFQQLLLEGQSALKEKRYARAEVFFEEALKLVPGDQRARKGRDEARQAQSTAALDDEQQKKFDDLVKQGQDALSKKQYALAIQAFEAALEIRRGDEAARKYLDEAKVAVAQDSSEKKKLEDYKAYLAEGEKALVDKRYRDAVREFSSALRLLPNDPLALQRKQVTEKRLEELAANEAKGEKYLKLLKAGRNALTANLYDEAIRQFEDAVQLVPVERDAQLALADAKRKRDEAKREYSRLMTQGENAQLLGNYQGAIRLYNEAVQLLPENEGGQRALKNAQAKLAEVNTAAATYLQLMTTGALAMRNGRYADAVVAFGEALKILPLDLDAKQGYAEARKALDIELKKKNEYDKQMQLGQNALTVRRYTDAVRAFQEAARLFPDDLVAASNLSKASLQLHLSDGQIALAAKKYKDAIREFEAALKENPNDITAKTGLAQAKALDKK